MKNKNTCGECRYFDDENDWCFMGRNCIQETYADTDACNEFEQVRKILFDRITQSPEVLAEVLVFAIGRIVPDYNHIVTLWYSSIIPDVTFETRTEAYAATVARLKEVCDE